jgi:hypothetical protein
MFGGAIQNEGKFSITSDTFLYYTETKNLIKLESKIFI